MRTPNEIYRDVLALAQVMQDLPSQDQDLAHASESRKLAERVVENLTDVSAQWLGNATPICERLMAQALDRDLSDEDFIAAVEAMALAMPGQFDTLDWQSLAREMEKVQGAAIMNGAVQRIREFQASQK